MIGIGVVVVVTTVAVGVVVVGRVGFVDCVTVKVVLPDVETMAVVVDAVVVDTVVVGVVLVEWEVLFAVYSARNTAGS